MPLHGCVCICVHVCACVCVLALKCGTAVGEATGHEKRKKIGFVLFFSL